MHTRMHTSVICRQELVNFFLSLSLSVSLVRVCMCACTGTRCTCVTAPTANELASTVEHTDFTTGNEVERSHFAQTNVLYIHA